MSSKFNSTFNHVSKLIDGYKVTKTTTGGKRMSFCAVVVTGNGRGAIGYSIGKSKEMPDAIKKGIERAKKVMTSIPLRKGGQLFFNIDYRTRGNRIVIKNGPAGSGIVCATTFRFGIHFLGLKNVTCKYEGTGGAHVKWCVFMSAVLWYKARVAVYKEVVFGANVHGQNLLSHENHKTVT